MLSAIEGDAHGIGASALRGVLSGLAYVYSAGLEAYLLPYRTGIRRQYRLPCPVVSIGNLTVGGTGKTPMTSRVCRILQERGLRPCVLSRGYRGSSENSVAVVSTAEQVEMDAKAAGDEAYLLARTLPGVPVVVGRDRRQSGRLAWGRFHPDVVVLDDGMQFYQLHRDLDVVLLDAQRPFHNGWTFPRGLLREPPTHLRRAGCVVITNADRAAESEVAALRARAQRLAPRAQVVTAAYRAVGLRALDRSGDQPVEWLAGRPVASFCALGNPAGFAAQLVGAGASVVHEARMPDHHEPTMAELNEFISAARAAGAAAVIVTAKDAVKLPPLGRPLSFYALEVDLTIDDEAGFANLLLGAARK